MKNLNVVHVLNNILNPFRHFWRWHQIWRLSKVHIQTLKLTPKSKESKKFDKEAVLSRLLGGFGFDFSFSYWLHVLLHMEIMPLDTFDSDVIFYFIYFQMTVHVLFENTLNPLTLPLASILTFEFVVPYCWSSIYQIMF